MLHNGMQCQMLNVGRSEAKAAYQNLPRHVKKLVLVEMLIPDYNFQTFTTDQYITMGRRAKNKQSDPSPLPGSDIDRSRSLKAKGKKKAPSTPDERRSVKAAKGVNAKSGKERRHKVVERRPKKIDQEVEDDSDLEEALRPG